MWARSSSTYIRARGLRLGATHNCGRLGKHVQHKFADAEHPKVVLNPWLRFEKFYSAVKIPPFFSLGSRNLSSHAGARSGRDEEDELDKEVSELEIAQGSKNTHMDDYNESVSDEPVLEHSSEGGQAMLARILARSSLFSILMREPPKSVYTALDKYASEGKSLDVSEISHAMLALRKHRMYQKALQFSEWLEAKKVIEFAEEHYASRLDLIAKVHGLRKAERYIQSVPESFRGEFLYRTLLANCVSLNNLKKAEEVYNKMRQSSFAATAFTCNQMLILYKRIDKKKIADVLLYMEKENVKPTAVTYRLLIDAKGSLSDITGMEQILDKMKAEGIELDVNTKSVLAKHYIAAGLKDKAESVLREMEGKTVRDTRAVCGCIIPLYASLGKEDEVKRLWKICEPNPRDYEYIVAIDAWGKLKQINKAEAVFEELEKTKKLTSRFYNTMLRVYAENKMLSKAKDLMTRMGKSGCRGGPLTWDALVKLYVEAGEVEKADTILHKAIAQQNNKAKPLFNSYMMIMEEYASRGDVHNSEKMFSRLKQGGYAGRIRPFQTLLKAYMKSKTPAYGFRERMMVENVFAKRSMALELAQADPFKKTAVSDLLD